MTDVEILESVRTHWWQLCGRTYDLMDTPGDADLKARLPFPESQDVFYQLRCMLGSQESWWPVLLEGRMRGWACSPDAELKTGMLSIRPIRAAMEAADERLDEAHLHGQLINLIYPCGFTIPESWTDTWGLSRG